MARKRKLMARRMVATVVFLVALTVAVYYFSLNYFKPSFVRYPGFNIDLPANYMIHGIDVSRYQNSISWKDVKTMEDQGIRIGFVFMKATEGTEGKDERFRRNWLHAGKHGLPRGAYHFFIPTKSGRLQASNFIKTARLEAGDLPPVLDIEENYGAPVEKVRKEVREWLQITEKHYKVRPIIYSNIDFYNNYLAGIFDDYPLWVAHYLVKDKPRIQRNWIFWQHSDRGRVNGINAYVDFNVFSGDSLAFDSLRIKKLLQDGNGN